MSRTILLADDSVTIQKVVELTFMEEDYEVVAVGDGDAALAKLAELTPDLLIVDVHMPGADGYEVCRQVKERLPDVPVLLLVGTFESFDEEQARRSGADGSLKKPFDSRDLLEKAQALIAGGSRAESSAPPAAEASSASAAGDAAWAPAPAPGTPTFEPLDLEIPPQPPPAPGSVEEVPAGILAHGSPTTAPSVHVPTPPAPVPEAVAAPVDATVEAGSGESAEVGESAARGDAASSPSSAGGGNGSLSQADVERIARRLAELVGEQTVRDVVWEVVPDLAEVIIRERIRELEEQVE